MKGEVFFLPSDEAELEFSSSSLLEVDSEVSSLLFKTSSGSLPETTLAIDLKMKAEGERERERRGGKLKTFDLIFIGPRNFA